MRRTGGSRLLNNVPSLIARTDARDNGGMKKQGLASSIGVTRQHWFFIQSRSNLARNAYILGKYRPEKIAIIRPGGTTLVS
jgi:hypothetical protein